MKFQWVGILHLASPWIKLGGDRCAGPRRQRRCSFARPPGGTRRTTSALMESAQPVRSVQSMVMAVQPGQIAADARSSSAGTLSSHARLSRVRPSSSGSKHLPPFCEAACVRLHRLMTSPAPGHGRFSASA